jgi:uncharacterized protein (DUF362 family)/NAD-dependent dihydropyrimidine dehydrogenase PreA subunit
LKTETETVVSITKVEHNIEKAVREAIHLAGGMETVVSKGDKVYLKPNFVAPRDSSKGVTTNFEVIRVVAEEVRRCGGIPILFETPAIEFDNKTVFDVLGVFDFAEQNKINLINGPLDLIRVPVPEGKVFKYLKIPEFLHNAKVINLPKLKTHVSAKITCGMKNLIGVLPDSEKRKVHIWDVHESIADIYKVIQPVLTVVDATTCMEGDGPTYGDKVNLGLIISGKDTVATDKVCSQIIGLSWEEVKYLRLANRNSDKVKVAGESITDVQRYFNIPQKSSIFHLCFRLIYVFDILFSKIFDQHLNQFLYSTGYVGTNPKIIKDKCNECGDCIEVCPIAGVINIENYKVDYKNCIRCLDCYFACTQQAIIVKGVSRPKEH